MNDSHSQLMRQIYADLLGILNRIEMAMHEAKTPVSEQALPRVQKPAAAEPAALRVKTLNDRHHWILTQLSQGVLLTRRDVMAKYGYCTRSAKRYLGELTRRGLIEFKRDVGHGHYVLCMNLNANTHTESP